MRLKKIASAGILSLLLCSLLFPQSLAELAKKEKERREKFKEKKSVLVTNADLAKIKKRAAILVPQSTGVRGERAEISSPARKSPPEKSPQPKTEEADKIESQTASSDLEERWRKAKEYGELLTLKINALWQEFYSLDDSTSQERLLREIDKATAILQKAQEDEEKIKKELEKLR